MIELGDGKAPGRVRTLRFPEGECAKLAAAVVLTIGMALDHDEPGAGPPPPAPEPPPAPAPESPPAPARDPTALVETARPAAPAHRRAALGVGAGLSLGAVPAASARLAAGV